MSLCKLNNTQIFQFYNYVNKRVNSNEGNFSIKEFIEELILDVMRETKEDNLPIIYASLTPIVLQGLYNNIETTRIKLNELNITQEILDNLSDKVINLDETDDDFFENFLKEIGIPLNDLLDKVGKVSNEPKKYGISNNVKATSSEAKEKEKEDEQKPEENEEIKNIDAQIKKLEEELATIQEDNSPRITEIDEEVTKLENQKNEIQKRLEDLDK